MLGDLLIAVYAACAEAIEALPRRVQFAIAAVFLLVFAAVVHFLVP